MTENNSKTLNALIKRLKSTYKNKSDVDPYKMAYHLMPSTTEASLTAKQMYINGHLCYAHKLSLVTNGQGIIPYIAFLDNDFKQNHQELGLRKNQIRRMKIKQSQILWRYSQLSQIFFRFILIFRPNLFLAMRPLIPLLFSKSPVIFLMH
ncbi:hypothetical protein [Acetobacterium tundrae]|uniref:Uncharacterized protein n=1 Tax=Acetobacterium tundrae TaxID=132932 RepID=A0ABR6WND3_9FIRM|nr:hypothetical protein [Acetobacterium tundrae]MBC3797994.1 hypothetical protein [Acetobacterium tundrae]